MSAQSSTISSPKPRTAAREQEGGGVLNSQVKISVRELHFFYSKAQALYDINIDLAERVVTAFIGPSGCGKSTFLRTLNRMNDIIPGTRVEGEVYVDGKDIYAPGTDVVDLRLKVGMIFQKS